MATGARPGSDPGPVLAAADSSASREDALGAAPEPPRPETEELESGLAGEHSAALRRQAAGHEGAPAGPAAPAPGQDPPPSSDAALEPFRAAFDGSALAMAQCDLRSGRLLRANAAFRALLGRAEAELTGEGGGAGGGTDLLDLLHPEDRAAGEAAFHELAKGSGPASLELRCLRRDGGVVPARLDLTRVAGPAPGHPAQVFAVLQDTTAQRAAAERQALLARETDHRARNLLAVMQTVIRLTQAPDLEAYRRAIEGRIGAVARAHSLLSGERRRGTRLRRLVEEELAPYAGPAAAHPERVRLAGPDLSLAPAAVQPLSMALHELATNAAKYGALSAPGGLLSVEWELAEAEGLLRLRWTEQGGPPVPAVLARCGFGSRLLLATVEEQLGGWVVKAWEPAGLRCEIGIPAGRGVLAVAAG